MKSLQQVIEDLMPSFKKMLKGKYAITLSGSYAKGYADSNSDIDFLIYTEDLVGFADRKKIIDEISDPNQEKYISENINNSVWGGSIDFYYNSNKIETNLRSYDRVNEVLENCLQGKFTISPANWTMNGYYDYVYLSEIDFVKALEDPFNIVANWKEQIKPYPQKLKESIMKEFWQRAHSWLDNFHYHSAIQREDIIYTSGVVHQIIHNLIQIIFALNETYFIGDKKIESQLINLRYCPQALTDQLEFLLSAPMNRKHLEKQKEILKEIALSIERNM